MVKDPQRDPNVHLYLACCYFFLGMYREADEEAQKGNPFYQVFLIIKIIKQLHPVNYKTDYSFIYLINSMMKKD